MNPVITHTHQGFAPSATGNAQFAGRGIVKWCALCGTHKPQLGGGLHFVLGGRQWVCAAHPRAVK